MKKLYTLIAIMAIAALAVNAQKPRLRPFRSHTVSPELTQNVSTALPLWQGKALATAPRHATALGQTTLSYCDGEYDNALGVGSVSLGDSLAGAIAFTKSQLSQYAGKTIGTLYVPVYQTSGLKAVYGWVAAGRSDSIVAMKQLPTLAQGYNELTFDKPVEIDGETNLYFGASYVLEPTASGSQVYCVPANTEAKKTVGGFYLGYGSSETGEFTWYDFHSQGYGVFAIEAMVDGVEKPANDVTVTDLTIEREDVRIDGILRASIDFKNSGANPVSSFDVEISIDGEKTRTLTLTLDSPVKSDRKGTADIEEQLAFAEASMESTLGIKVVNVNGEGDDENMDDNSAEATFNAYEKLFPRNVLVEEGTGQWCGYCPQGIVAMDAMHEKNLDDFVGVAIHHGYLGNRESVSVDSMAFAVNNKGYEYCSILGITSFPTALYNRQYEASGYYAQTYYEYLREFESTAKIFGRAYWDGNSIVVSGDVQFGFSSDSGANYYVQTYLIEDGVGPYYQHNYYAGTSTSMGGFENLPEWTPVVYNDVLRGVYPELTTVATLGEQLTTGSISPSGVYQFKYTYDISDEVNRVSVVDSQASFEAGPRYADKDKLRLVLVLSDADNGYEVLNCCKVAISADEAAGVSTVKEAENAPIEYYSINGTRLAAPASTGVYIEKQGTRVVKRIGR